MVNVTNEQLLTTASALVLFWMNEIEAKLSSSCAIPG